jgi:hypothetical protein
MTDAKPEIPNYVRPKLNRPELRKRLEEKVDLVPFDAEGSFTLCLKSFRVEPGQTNSPFYMAGCTVLTSDDPARLPVGVSRNLWFPINRGNTPTDKFRQNRDDERLTAFILAVYRIMPGQPFDVEKGLDELIEQGKIEGDQLKFRIRHEKEPYKQKIVHPVTKEIIQEIDRIGTKQHFEPYVEAPAA